MFVDHVFTGPVLVYILLDMHLPVNLKAVDILHNSICITNFFSASFSFFLICFLKKKKSNCFLALRCKFQVLSALDSKFSEKRLQFIRLVHSVLTENFEAWNHMWLGCIKINNVRISITSFIETRAMLVT